MLGSIAGLESIKSNRITLKDLQRNYYVEEPTFDPEQRVSFDCLIVQNYNNSNTQVQFLNDNLKKL